MAGNTGRESIPSRFSEIISSSLEIVDLLPKVKLVIQQIDREPGDSF